MYGKYFEYNGHKSTDFGLMLGGFDVSSDVPFAMARDIYAGTLNRYRNKVNHMGTKWSNVLQFDLSFIKDVCANPNQEDLIFSEDEVNEINAWLTSPDFPLLFHMYDYDETTKSDYDSIYFRKDLLINDGESMLLGDGENVLHVEVVDEMFVDFIFKSNGEFIVSFYAFHIGFDEDYEDPIRIDVNDRYVRMIFNGGKNKFLSRAIYSLNGTSLEKSESALWSYENGNSCRVLIGRELSWNHKYDYFGLFSNVTPQIFQGDVIGFNATFITNSPFAWTEEKVVSHEMSGEESESITFTVNSSEWERELYPLIEIIGVDSSEFNYDPETHEYTGDASARETITISNNNDCVISYRYEGATGYPVAETPRSLTVKVPHSPVYIDCENGRIYDIVSTVSGGINRILGFEDLGLQDVSHIYWPRLFNGENNWTITGNCKIKIKYREPRKVGAY